MGKFLARLTFMLTFFTLGTVFGVAAHGEDIETAIDPAPRAIQCSAAFELMGLVAPQWSQQTDVIKARFGWADYVNSLSDQAGANAHEQVSNEMALMAEALAVEPSELSRLAAQCVADAPTANISG